MSSKIFNEIKTGLQQAIELEKNNAKKCNYLTWVVKHYDCNYNKIKDYDVLKYEDKFIRKLKKQAQGNKEYFTEELKHHLMHYYWSKCEWEVIISKQENRVFLSPWCGCSNPEEVTTEVTNDTTFDWLGFADKHIKRQIFDNVAKIDVWDQIEYRWEEFVDYCWNTRLKWERKSKE